MLKGDQKRTWGLGFSEASLDFIFRSSLRNKRETGVCARGVGKGRRALGKVQDSWLGRRGEL